MGKEEKKSDKLFKLENELKKIAEQSGKKFSVVKNEYIEIRVGEIFSEYLEIYDLLNKSPSTTSASIRRKFNAIKKTAIKLQECIQTLSPQELSWLGTSDSLKERDAFKWVTVDNKNEADNIIQYLDSIVSRANRTIDFFSNGRTGRPTDIAMKYFIKRMIFLWKEITGKKPTITYDPYSNRNRGPFLDLVYTCLNKLGKPPQSKDSTAKRIKR